MKNNKRSFAWNQVTPLSKYLAMVLFVALPFIGFVLGVRYQKNVSINSSQRTQPLVGKSPQRTLPSFVKSPPPILTPPATETSMISTSYKTDEGDPQITKKDNSISFYDSVNKYHLDLTSLPEISLTERDTDDIYEFEMYAQTAHSLKGSVARFGLSQLLDNSEHVSLSDFAIKKYGYKQGTDDSGGWGSLTTSPIKEVKVGHNYPAITWNSENPSGGTFFFNYYLIQVKDKIVYAKLVTWNKKTFDVNVGIFKSILTTFRVD